MQVKSFWDRAHCYLSTRSRRLYRKHGEMVSGGAKSSVADELRMLVEDRRRRVILIFITSAQNCYSIGSTS